MDETTTETASKAKKAAAKSKSVKDKRKHKYPKTAAEKRKAHERMMRFKKSMAKREEPNDDEKKVMEKFRKGAEHTLRELANSCFPSSSKSDRYLRVKNAFRWLRVQKKVKAVVVKRADKKLSGYKRVA